MALEARLRAAGVRMRLGTTIRSLRVEGGRMRAALTDQGAVEAGHFVLCLGFASPFLVRPLGIHLPIYPLKGYSLTLPAGTRAPRVSITDFKRKVVYAPLAEGDGRFLRVAGMADIAGYSAKPDPVRIGQLYKEARQAFPSAGDYTPGPEGLKPWAGLRPATPRGTPLLGATPVANLTLDCGHGALGWTLALGSAQVVADLVAGRAPEVPVDGFMLRP